MGQLQKLRLKVDAVDGAAFRVMVAGERPSVVAVRVMLPEGVVARRIAMAWPS